MIRFEEVQSQKGGRNLVHGGYRLRKSKEKNGRQYWSCIVKGCRARATTVVGTLDGAISAPHDHPPCISRKKVLRILFFSATPPLGEDWHLLPPLGLFKDVSGCAFRPVLDNSLPLRKAFCYIKLHHFTSDVDLWP